MRSTPARLVAAQGAGPFTTRRVYQLDDGSRRVWESRRERTGRAMHNSEIRDFRARLRSPRLQFWAPRRLSYWMAVGYVAGSVLFVLGATAALIRGLSLLTDISYFVGAQVWTVTVYVHLLAALNRADDMGPHGRRLRKLAWFGWQPRQLGFLIALAFLVGAVLFSVETTVVVGEALGWFQATYLAGYTSLAASVLFVAGGYLQVLEVCHAACCVRPRSISWWSTALIALGCVSFLVGSVFGLNVPGLSSFGEPTVVIWSFLVGSVLFLAGSYLILPEIFSE